MPNNNLTSWPPEPEAGKPAAIKQPVKNTAGRISLGLTVGGWLYIVLILVRMYGHPEPWPNSGEYGILDALTSNATIAIPIILAVFVAGLVAGIVGRRSLPGKIGIALTVAFAALSLVGFLWLVVSLNHNPDMFG